MARRTHRIACQGKGIHPCARPAQRRAPRPALGEDRQDLCVRHHRGQAHARQAVRRPQPAHRLPFHAGARLERTAASAARSLSITSTARWCTSRNATSPSSACVARAAAGNRGLQARMGWHFRWVSSHDTDFQLRLPRLLPPGGDRQRPRRLQTTRPSPPRSRSCGRKRVRHGLPAARSITAIPPSRAASRPCSAPMRCST